MWFAKIKSVLFIFFAHPKNLLLAIVINDKKHIQELGYRYILEVRKSPNKGKTIRNFMSPKQKTLKLVIILKSLIGILTHHLPPPFVTRSK